MNTCDTPWQVYVETGTNADLNLFLNLASISPTEAVYTMFRPKGLRTTRHGGREPGRNKKLGARGKWRGITEPGEAIIPDSMDLVAETIHSATEWEKPVYGTIGTYLFEIARPIIAAAYYLTIVNAVTDFAYDWYSGILLAPESKCTIGRYSIGCGIIIGSREGYVRMVPVSQAYHPIGVTWDITGITVHPGYWTVIAVIECDTDWPPFQTGDVFVKLMIGIADDQQCGKTVKVSFTKATGFQVRKAVWKIKGGEKFNIHAAYSADDPLAICNLNFSGVQGFRI